MRSIEQIIDLLPCLDEQIADELEGQDLDFKEWDIESSERSISLVVKMAICMANGGGGTVVFGVADKVLGRTKAIIGVPPSVDMNRLRRAVYDRTDPKITPNFQEIFLSKGGKRLLVMTIHPGMPPYTDTSGRGTVRVGKDCQPLTGSMRGKISVETGECDYTAERTPVGFDATSPSALEVVRELARMEHAPTDLVGLDDRDLLKGLGLLRGEELTRAGLLMVGQSSFLEEHCSGYCWTYLRMEGDTNYSHRIDGNEPIPVAIQRIEREIASQNPITTLKCGLFHFEYRAYPEVALREALLNAFSHCDFRLRAPILVKQFADRLEISNPGGFIGGITPTNILHHQPVPRNPRLVEALLGMRLVNRSNLGVSRMYEALLVEGKEPPLIAESGDTVSVSFFYREFSPSFRAFVESASLQGAPLDVDELIVIQHLLRQVESDTSSLARLCQRDEFRMKQVLSRMESCGRLERGGSGRGTYWTLLPSLRAQLAPDIQSEQGRRIAWEAAKARVYSIVLERSKRGLEGISSKEVRQITHYDRRQVTRLMKDLCLEHPEIVRHGHGAGTRYSIQN